MISIDTCTSIDTISTTVLTVVSHALPSLMLIGQSYVYRYTLPQSIIIIISDTQQSTTINMY